MCPEHNTKCKVKIQKIASRYKINAETCCDLLKDKIENKWANLVTESQADDLADSFLKDFPL